MQWIKVKIGGVDKLVNMDQYKWLEEDPGDAEKCLLTHNDASTISIDATYELAVIFFTPLLYKEDALSNPL